MKKIFAALAACAFLLTACDAAPGNVIMWSPDGKRVAVADSDEFVRIADSKGALLGPAFSASLFRWAPDSTHAVIVSETGVTKWSELKSLLSKQEQLSLIRTAESLWTSNSRSKWEGSGMAQTGMVYLANKYGAKAVEAKLARVDRGWKKVPGMFVASVKDLYTVDCSNNIPTAKHKLMRSLNNISDVRISPSGKLLAISIAADHQQKMVVISLPGGEAKTVVPSLAQFPDWSSDGKSLCFISYPKSDSKIQVTEIDSDHHPVIGTLSRVDVADENGVVLVKVGPPKALVEVIVSKSSRVRCLSDGSILFNAAQRDFPSVKKTAVPEAIYKLSTDGKSLSRIQTSQDLPDDLQYFEPNQDATKIAVPGTKGSVAVVDVASGNVEMIENAGDNSLKIAPSWRTSDELCYAARNKVASSVGHNTEVVVRPLSAADNAVVLSKDWPVNVLPLLKDEEKKAEATKDGHHANSFRKYKRMLQRK